MGYQVAYYAMHNLVRPGSSQYRVLYGASCGHANRRRLFHIMYSKNIACVGGKLDLLDQAEVELILIRPHVHTAVKTPRG